jgi:hypothetical protein
MYHILNPNERIPGKSKSFLMRNQGDELSNPARLKRIKIIEGVIQ